MYGSPHLIIAIAVKKLAVPVAIAGVASGLVSGSLSALPVQTTIASPNQSVVVTMTPAPVTSSPEATDLFVAYFGHEAAVARAIAIAENREQDPNLVHTNKDYATLPDKPRKHYFPKGSEDFGLMQINLFWNWESVPGQTKVAKIKWLTSPENNIRLAKEIRDDWGNFRAWSTYQDGTYKKYLERK